MDTTYPLKRRALLVMFVILSLLSLTLAGCKRHNPIKIGFAGCLTGRLSDLGVAGRNGVILAVEQINTAGGIQGRPIELLVRDDQHDPEIAKQVDQDLIDAGVAAIIGHLTSAMSMAAVPLVNEEQMVLISPTTSTNELTGLDDYFLRVCPSSNTQTDQLARYAFTTMGLRKIASVYDLSNRAFAEGLYQNFKTQFENMGGTLVHTTTFTSGEPISYLTLTRNLLDVEADGLFIVASALDTALLCQQLRKENVDIPIISSAWAFTPDIIRHGGSAVEGLIFSEAYYKESKHPDYLAFQREFRNRFGHEPGFAGTFSYEAARVVFTALAQTDDSSRLKEVIIAHQVFAGLQGQIRIDRYGDAQRKRFVITIKNGQFVTVD
jgi:branched-chain amino acid transport system substrate-binding protein